MQEQVGENRDYVARNTTGKENELINMMEKRNVDILCVQETSWKHWTSIQGFLPLCRQEKKYVNSVMEAKRVSYSMNSLKLELKGVIVECCHQKKDEFSHKLDKVVESITGERVVIG